MLGLIASFLVLYAASVLLKPLLRYIRDENGLRKYPGENFLSGISGIGHNWEVGRKHKLFHTKRLHDKLMKEPVIRVAPKWLSFGRSRAVQDIYGYNSPCKKAPIYDVLQGGGAHMNNITDKSAHTDRRRMVAATYAPRNTDKWIGYTEESALALVNQMDRMSTAPLWPGQSAPKEDDLTFDGTHWSYMFTIEALLKVGISKNMHFVDAGNDLVSVKDSNGRLTEVSVVEGLHGGGRATSMLIWDTELFPTLKKIAIFVSPWYKRNFEYGGNWRRIAEDLVAERVERYQNGEELDDLFTAMIEDKNGQEPDISNLDRVAEVDQMINGGADACSISLANTIYYIVKNPYAHASLREELDAALAPSEKVVPWSKAKSLDYLRACINESMRLSPPVATDLTRKTPPEGHTIDGETVPGNTTVSISAYTAHRDADLFPDPESFKPERWLIKGDDRLKQMNAVWIPFTAGPRACIGRNVTILFQLVYLATIFYRYDFALTSKDWEQDWEDTFNLWPNPLPMKIWRRCLNEGYASEASGHGPIEYPPH